MPQRILVSQRIGAVDGLLLRPPAARALLVLAHGAGAGMQHAFMESMAQAFANLELATLRYQFPYIQAGRKPPDVPNVLLSTVAAALRHALQVAPQLPMLLAGKSMGGRMSAYFMARDAPQTVRGIIFLGFPLHTPGKPAITRAAALNNVRVPMLFLQGSKDKLADPILLAEVCRNLGQRAVLNILHDADHSFAVPKRRNLTPAQVTALLAQQTADFVEELI